MLTGDQRLTAESVGRDLGVLGPEDRSLDGGELDSLTGADRDRLISRARAFSRVTPEHKLVIVRSLQSTGEIVAMLGDGTNDAAALKQANVGVAMGIRGTDVAKEAAAIVLQDDRFETVAAAVEEGRVIFDNIRKFVFYLFSCNVAEVLVLLVAGLAGLPLPLAPLQLLWLNMVTDTFPALALAMEPGDPDVMRRPPQDPQEVILSRAFLTSVLTFGVLITASTLAAFVWALGHAPERAPTMAFMTLALAQIAHLGNARSRGPVLRLERVLANPYALAGAGLAVLLQALAVVVDPLARILRVTPLDSLEWLVVVGLASIPAIAGQALKAYQVDTGRLTVTVVPVAAEAMAIVPPCTSTRRFAVGSPRPEPRDLVVKNGMKIFSCNSVAMPGPLSVNVTWHIASAQLTPIRMEPSPRMACAAFASRLWKTMRSISASALMGGAAPSISTCTWRSAGSRVRRSAVRASSDMTSTGAIRGCGGRANSSRSLISSSSASMRARMSRMTVPSLLPAGRRPPMT